MHYTSFCDRIVQDFHNMQKFSKNLETFVRFLPSRVHMENFPECCSSNNFASLLNLDVLFQVLGMLSNLALIVSVMKFGHLQQIHNLIITSLSFADGFFLLYETVIRVPQSITETFTSVSGHG